MTWIAARIGAIAASRCASVSPGFSRTWISADVLVREQVGEARLRRVGPARRVEDDLLDERRVVERRDARRGPVLQRRAGEVGLELRLGAGRAAVASAVLLGLRREPARLGLRAGRAAAACRPALPALPRLRVASSSWIWLTASLRNVPGP